jgi:hypothetical protein
MCKTRFSLREERITKHDSRRTSRAWEEQKQQQLRRQETRKETTTPPQQQNKHDLE